MFTRVAVGVGVMVAEGTIVWVGSGNGLSAAVGSGVYVGSDVLVDVGIKFPAGFCDAGLQPVRKNNKYNARQIVENLAMYPVLNIRSPVPGRQIRGR